MVSEEMERVRSIAAVGEGGVMQVIDSECEVGAGMEQCMNIEMVDVLLKVSCWR